MSTPTLRHVTLESLENYRTAATQAVVAYRAGSHRLVGAVNGTLKNSVYPRTAKLAPRATHRIDAVRGNLSDVVVKGIDQVAERAEQAIAFSADTAAEQLNKAANFAAGIDNSVVANGLQTAARLTMPGAQAALVVSTQVAKGATKLADLAGAKPVKTAVRKATRSVKAKTAPVVRKAKAAVKAVKAPVAPAKRAVRSAKKAVQAA
jgi:hypothetical protein